MQRTSTTPNRPRSARARATKALSPALLANVRGGGDGTTPPKPGIGTSPVNPPDSD